MTPEQQQRAEIQRQVDELDSELKLNYELCRELESRRAELDKQLNPDDYK